MDAAVAALVGAFVGAVGPVIAGWIQRDQQSRSDLLKEAVLLGRADYEFRMRQLKESGVPAVMPTVTLFIAHHANVLRSIRDGTFNAEEVHRLGEESDKLEQAYAERRLGRKVEK